MSEARVILHAPDEVRITLNGKAETRVMPLFTVIAGNGWTRTLMRIDTRGGDRGGYFEGPFWMEPPLEEGDSYGFTRQEPISGEWDIAPALALTMRDEFAKTLPVEDLPRTWKN